MARTRSAGMRFHCEMAWGRTPAASASALTLPATLIARSIGFRSIPYERQTFGMTASISLRDGRACFRQNESMSFAENLKRLLTERGISHAELGRHLNISGQAVSQWLSTCGTAPRHARLREIAAFFQIPVSALTDEIAGFSDAGLAFASPPGARLIPDIEASDPAEDEGYEDLIDAAEAMLATENANFTPKELALLAKELWREFQDDASGRPVADRVQDVIERRRLMIQTAKRLRIGRWRAPR